MDEAGRPTGTNKGKGRRPNNPMSANTTWTEAAIREAIKSFKTAFRSEGLDTELPGFDFDEGHNPEALRQVVGEIGVQRFHHLKLSQLCQLLGLPTDTHDGDLVPIVPFFNTHEMLHGSGSTMANTVGDEHTEAAARLASFNSQLPVSAADLPVPGERFIIRDYQLVAVAAILDRLFRQPEGIDIDPERVAAKAPKSLLSKPSRLVSEDDENDNDNEEAEIEAHDTFDRGGVLLADTVGLGKTIISLSVITTLQSLVTREAGVPHFIQGRKFGVELLPSECLDSQEKRDVATDLPDQPTLIVVPLGLQPHWISELSRFIAPGSFEIYRYHGSTHSRRSFWTPTGVWGQSSMPASRRIIVATAQSVQADFEETVARHADPPLTSEQGRRQLEENEPVRTTKPIENSLFSHRYRIGVVDEAHNYARGGASAMALSQLMKRVYSRLGLTATPIMNHPTDLFHVLRTCGISRLRLPSHTIVLRDLKRLHRSALNSTVEHRSVGKVINQILLRLQNAKMMEGVANRAEMTDAEYDRESTELSEHAKNLCFLVGEFARKGNGMTEKSAYEIALKMKISDLKERYPHYTSEQVTAQRREWERGLFEEEDQRSENADPVAEAERFVTEALVRGVKLVAQYGKPCMIRRDGESKNADGEKFVNLPDPEVQVEYLRLYPHETAILDRTGREVEARLIAEGFNAASKDVFANWGSFWTGYRKATLHATAQQAHSNGEDYTIPADAKWRAFADPVPLWYSSKLDAVIKKIKELEELEKDVRDSDRMKWCIFVHWTSMKPVVQDVSLLFNLKRPLWLDLSVPPFFGP